MTPDQKKKNRTLGLILGSVVLVFFLGFMVRLVYFGSPKKPQTFPSSASNAGAAAVPNASSK
jgi:flagellar basal body-associated protein FliL